MEWTRKRFGLLIVTEVGAFMARGQIPKGAGETEGEEGQGEAALFVSSCCQGREGRAYVWVTREHRVDGKLDCLCGPHTTQGFFHPKPRSKPYAKEWRVKPLAAPVGRSWESLGAPLGMIHGEELETE